MTKKERKKKNFQSHVIDFGHGDWFDNGTSLRNFERVFREVKSEDILCVCVLCFFSFLFLFIIVNLLLSFAQNRNFSGCW